MLNLYLHVILILIGNYNNKNAKDPKCSTKI